MAIKLAAMPISALLGLVALRALSRSYGSDGIALYGLTIAIPILIPFADFGLGGAAVEIVAGRRKHSRRVLFHELLKICKILIGVAMLLISISLALYFTGLMSVIAGLQSEMAGLALTLGVTIFALTVPLALGYRILLGLGRNPVVILVQTTSGIIGLTGVLVCASVNASLYLVVILPLVSAFAGAAVACAFAVKLLRKSVCDGRRAPLEVGNSNAKSIKLRQLAGANLVIGISLPIAYQAGRLVIVHRSGTDELAIFTAAYAIYGPFNSLLVTAGQSLWPRLTRIREDNFALRASTTRSWSTLMTLAVIPVCIALVVPGVWISSWTLGGLVEPHEVLGVLIALAMLLLVSGANAPFGMALMGEDDVKFQAFCFVAMAAVSLAICFFLAPSLGAAAAPIGSVWALAICLFIPSVYRVLKSRRTL